LPLMPLAQLKLFWLQKSSSGDGPAVTIEDVCQTLVRKPCIVTSFILSDLAKQAPKADEQKEARQWLARWEEQETARKVYTAAQPQLRFPLSNNVFWITVPNGAARLGDVNWLIISQPAPGTTNRFTCRPESQLGSIVSEFAKKPGLIPEYLGIEVEVARKRVTYTAAPLGVYGHVRVWREENWMGRAGGGVKRAYIEGAVPELLASSSDAAANASALMVSVYLTSPTVMLKRQEARAFWFKLLIGASIAAALVGLMTAYRAFDRQLRLNLAKTNFVSSVSHELRAPIASVRLMTESLERGLISDPQRQKEYYRLMHQECRRLSSLVENVLDLSRIEQGRKQYEFEPTDMVALVRETVELIKPQAAERNIALGVSNFGIPEDPTFAPVLDGKAVQQALVNLVDNAIKHSRDGQRITVGLEISERSAAIPDDPDRGKQVLLWVEDQGEGIPPEDHERIFEQFYRRGSELRRQTQGIGIGLSIVKHIVEAHKGRVLLRSAVSQGSRFTIELPIARDAAECEAHSHPATPQ
jgi:signal transduction histidine kinase